MNTQLFPSFSGIKVLSLANIPQEDDYGTSANEKSRLFGDKRDAKSAFMTAVNQKFEAIKEDSPDTPATLMELFSKPDEAKIIILDGLKDIQEFAYKTFMANQRIKDFLVKTLNKPGKMQATSAETLSPAYPDVIREVLLIHASNGHNWTVKPHFYIDELPIQEKIQQIVLEDMIAEHGDNVEYIDVTVDFPQSNEDLD